MREYDPKQIEAKWQAEWEKSGIYKTPDEVSGKENEYVLVEFAYPSGNLHVGHWYAFSVPDMYARYQRMNGKNVLYPMGFDAFGLPAENAAIKNKLNPRDWTFSNIDYMRQQLRSMGASFDWSREVVTASPEYYRWTQWMFLRFFEKGLAYQAEREVNWCPNDKTVLANEQVVDGRCERCSAEVVLKNLLQWNLKITEYADRLINDLESLNWPEPIKEAQRNWIGRSEGALIKFDDIEVFTTRPDTIYGATFLVKAGKQDRFTGEYVTNPATKEKIPVWEAEYVYADYGTGAIMGVPAHDERDFEFAKKHDLPIREVVAPYYVDSHDPPIEGKKTVPKKVVHAIVESPDGAKVLILKWHNYGWVSFVSGGVDGDEDLEMAIRREIKEETGYTDIGSIKKLGDSFYTTYHATHKDENRESEVHVFKVKLNSEKQEDKAKFDNEKFDEVWVTWEEAKKLVNQVEAPEFWHRLERGGWAHTDIGVLINSGNFSGRKSHEVLKEITEFAGGKWVTKFKLRDWVVSRQRYWGVPIPMVHCDRCGIVPVPEKDLPVTLPEIDDYLPRDDGKSPLSKANDWVNVKCPRCGGNAERETDTLDTFVDSSWYFLRYIDPNNQDEFASKNKLKQWMPVNFYSGGAEHTTMHLLYSRFWHKVLFDLGLVNEIEPYERRMNRGLIMGPDGQKMSKSRGNVIDPDKEVDRLGADTVRTYLAFIGPYNEVGSYPWNPDASVGVRRFLERVWKLKERIGTDSVTADAITDQIIQKVTASIVSMKMNTAVSSLMIYTNHLQEHGATNEEYETLLKLLAPFAPHITEELWHELGNTGSIHTQDWPKFDVSKLVKSEVVVALQVNGKVRGSMSVSAELPKDGVEKLALNSEEIKKWIEGKEIQKVIVVPQKIVNIVVK